MKTRLQATLLAQVALIALPGCWITPEDDAGDEAFVVAAKVAILGQRPTSHAEVEALAKLASVRGREAVVDVLLEQPEFVDYWGSVLLEELMVGPGDDRPADTSCFTEHKLQSDKLDDLVYHLTYKPWTTEFCPSSRPSYTSNLVTSTNTSMLPEWDALESAGPDGIIARLNAISRTPTSLRASTPVPIERGGMEYLTTGLDVDEPALPGTVPPRGWITTPSCESFTMADAARAAITEDRLDVLYRVGLVPLAVNHSQGDATVNFLKGWLDRDPGCMSCHTTLYSTTNARPGNDEWDRFENAHWVDLEGTVFSYTDGAGEHYGGGGGSVVYNNVQSFFRSDAFLAANGKNPFGIDSSCTTGLGRRGFNTTLPSDATQRVGFAGVNGTTHGPMKLVDEFALGVAALYDPDLADPPVYPGVNPGAAEPDPLAVCNGCHSAGNPLQAPPDLYAHTRTMAPWRIEDIVVNGSPAGLMGKVGDLTAAQKATARLIAHASYVPPRFLKNRHAGFALLVAMSAANNVYERMTGAPLDIDHDFPRNPDAAELLEELARELVDNQWSLKAVVRRIVLSDHFNRRAPDDSPNLPYMLPMVVAPWADVPGDHPNILTGEDRNGQGDLVHRWPIQNLLWQVHHALLWPEPPPIPSTSTGSYVDAAFVEELGAFTDLTHPGFTELVLPAILAWEDEIGTCARPAGVTSDYIDVLTDPAEGLTLEEAMLALKDRLISDGQWWPSESLLVEGMAGVTLDQPASAHAQAVRDYCAVLLQSPQFLLAGLPSWPEGEGPPDSDPTMPCVDDRCTYAEHCEYYRDEAIALGYDTVDCDLGLTGG
jgi:hypothetical protein